MVDRRDGRNTHLMLDCQWGLIGNADPSAADGVKQAVDGISIVLVESALAKYAQSVALGSAQIP